MINTKNPVQNTNIIFTIQTAYSTEDYFLTVTNSHSIELQIDEALANICYCDAYEIISYKEVNQEYVTQRDSLIKEYEAKYEPIIEAFCSGDMVTLETLKADIEWREL